MEDNITLLKSVLKHWKIIFASTVMMAALMFVLTRNMPRIYESTAVIYTGIVTGESIVNKERGTQYSAYDNLFNIIKSRETLKEVGLRLFAMHLGMKHPNSMIVSDEYFENLQKTVPLDIRQLVGETDSITYLNLNAIAESNYYLYQMINSFVPYYSISALSSVYPGRIGISDMYQLVYRCDDPGICQKTLEILIDVFIRNFRKMKDTQIEKKFEFFEKEVQLAFDKLKRAEEKEEKFKQKYNISDISIQTEMAMTDRQDLEKQIAEEQSKMNVANAAIRRLESQMGKQGSSTKRTDLSLKMDQLSNLTNQLTSAEMRKAPANQIATLKIKIETLKKELANDYAEISSTPGNSNDISTEFINKTLAFEESKTRLRILEAQKNTTDGKYTQSLPLVDSLRRMKRDTELCEKEWLSVLSDRNKSRREQQDQISFTHIQVYDKPNFPLSGKSNRMMIFMLGTMIGFVVPSSIFLGMSYLNNNIQTHYRAEEIIGLKSAGIMPNLNKLHKYKHTEMISNLLRDTILKSLYMVNHQSGQIRILIISTRPGEGKTVISNMLCERIIEKGRKCLVVMPYADGNDWSIVTYKVDKSSYQSRAEDIVPIERMNDADVLIIELPSLILNDHPVDLLRQFDIAFLICNANREWAKADQTALESFIKISGIRPQIILNDVDLDIVEEVLGKV